MKETVASYLTTMVLVKNDKDEVLLIDRKKDWKGLTFPGGHLEEGESIVECAKREILEETGIRIKDIKIKGLVNWYNEKNGDRFLVFAITSRQSGGCLKKGTDEGEVFFKKLEDIDKSQFAEGFFEQLPLFLDDSVIEIYGSYGTGKDSALKFIKSQG